MDINLAMLIIGSVLIIVGIVKNAVPVKFNEGIFGKLEGEAENIAASMRTIIGSLFIGMGVIALLNRNIHSNEGSKALVFSIGVGLIIFLLTILLSYARKFSKDIPVPPFIIVGVLIVIAFYSSIGSQGSGNSENTLDAVKLDPEHYTVELENDKVRVLRIKYGPGEKSVMHDHSEGVVVFLNDQEAKFTLGDGETFNVSSEAGQVIWANPVRHQPENIGSESAEVIQIELK